MKKAIFKVIWLLPLITLGSSLTFSVDPQDEPLFVIDEKFISVTLDSSNIASRFSDFDFTDPKLIMLMNYLTPLYFRIGGTTADTVVFSRNDNSSADVVLTGSDWLKLNNFTTIAGAKILFDLNSLLRNNDGSWNSENAEELIQFSQENLLDLDWELGNEPDLYQALFRTSVAASQLGKDYQNLRAILNMYPQYASASLIGPDMFDVGSSQAVQNYLSEFLEYASGDVRAVTWHQYYFPGDTATQESFLNPETFNYLEQRTKVVKNIVDKTGNKMWLGETSSAYKGGAPNLSDRYIATFLWLDKLGLAAKLGVELIIRQTFHGYNYALVSNSSDPLPDYWISVFHKNLVGTKVLSTSSDGSATSKIRLYAHCAKSSRLWNESSVVVFGLNIDSEAGSFEIEGLETNDGVYSFEFTSESTLLSQLVRLNGQVLHLTPQLQLPQIPPKKLEDSTTYTMPPYSMVFWVFTNTSVKACTS